MVRFRGAVIAVVGLTLAGMALALRGSLQDAALEPLFLGGGLIAIAGLGLGGYDYSRHSGADVLERGIWQAPRPAAGSAPPDALTLMAVGNDLNAGDPVVITHLPAGWLDNLLPEDQDAIRAILGRPVRFAAYEEDDRVEVSFIDACGHDHSLYLKSEFVRRVVL